MDLVVTWLHAGIRLVTPTVGDMHPRSRLRRVLKACTSSSSDAHRSLILRPFGAGCGSSLSSNGSSNGVSLACGSLELLLNFLCHDLAVFLPDIWNWCAEMQQLVRRDAAAGAP